MQKILLLFILLIFTTVHTYSAEPSGTIKGRITDEDKLSLAGANIFISELGIGVASNQNGEFTMVRVPVGTHKLTVSYLGFQTQTLEVVVKDNSTTSLDITLQSGLVEGNEVVVLGDKLKGQAKALNQQKTNENVTNIVSSDQIGRFPDANIGDALKRIQGLTVNYDQGEARFVNIRGTEPRFNSIMINGERIPSAEAEIRNVQVDLIPSDVIQTIEVNKTITPDLDGDAIGGSVNLITRQAPNDFRVSGTLGSGFNFLSSKPIWNGSITLGQRFMDNNLGVMISAAYHNHDFGSDNTEGTWDIGDNGQIFTDEWEVRKYVIQRIRRSISGSLDYRLSPTSTVYFSGIYNHRDDWENRFRLRFTDLSELDANGNTTSEIRRQTKGGIGNDMNDNARLEDQRTQSFSLSGNHLIADAIKFNWSGSMSKASEERPNERYIQYRIKDVPVNVDVTDPENPYITPLDLNDVSLDKFKFHELTEEYQLTEETDITGKLDLEIPFATSGEYKNSLKFGGKYKSKEKSRENNFFEYEPVDGYEYLSDVGNGDYSDADFLAGEYMVGSFVTEEFIGSLDLENPALFEKTDAIGEYAAVNFSAEEKIISGYAMLKQNLGKDLLMIVGARLEKTDVDYKGFEFNDDSETVTPQTGSDSYTNVLPSIHFKYNLDPNTILRAAWTNSLARPNYYDLVPYRNIAVEDEELEIGNPSLKPTTSMNFDLMAEHYYSNVGIVSGGIFYKSIKDFIYTHSEEDYLDPISNNVYQLFQPRNGAEATLFGVELAYQRRLDFLPGFLQNVALYLNYTYTNSNTKNPQYEEEEIDLPGTAPHTLNTNLTYQDSKFTFGISFNYTASYIDPDEVILTPGLERYYDRVTHLDLNAAYSITPQFRIYFELNNILNQPLRYYAGDRSRTYQAEYYDKRMNAGLKFDL